MLSFMMSTGEKSRKRTGEIAKRLAERIRHLREEKGWSQYELARQLEVKRTSIANYESALSFPPLPVLERMAQTFGVSLDGLVWGQDAPENAIQDRELLAHFKRIERLSIRAKATIMDVLDAILQREEQAGRTAGELSKRKAG